MASNQTIVTLSFAVEGSTDPLQVTEQVHGFAKDNVPSNWRLINQTIRDPSYGSQMLTAALTGSN